MLGQELGFVTVLSFYSQSDLDATVKLEFDDEGLGGEGGTGENSVTKPKAPRVKKEKKEPGQFFVELLHLKSLHFSMMEHSFSVHLTEMY